MSEKKKDESKVKKEQELIKLLKSGARSYKFLEQKFGLIEEQIGDILDKAVGYVPFTMRNQYNEMVVTLVKKPGKIIEKPKDFIIRKAEKTPYLQINIPHKERHKIDIILLADLHYGSNACDIKTLQRWVHWMEKQDDTYIILLGDLIEMAHKSSVGAGVYEQMNPQAQAVGVVELLQPIKDKILLSVNGNHEKRSYVALGFDVGYFIAERLGVPYYTEPAHLDITFADYTFTFFCWHGRSNAMTEGGKLNAALFPLNFTEHCSFYCSAHVHDRTAKVKERICRDVERGELVRKKQYALITGSFMNYWGTYASQAGYPPPSNGASVAVLYENGDYRSKE